VALANSDLTDSLSVDNLSATSGPGLVIDTGRHGFVILVADIIPELHIPHLGHQHAAEMPRLHIVVKCLRDRQARQLSARLNDALIALCGLYHESPLADVVRDGLLDVDILAGIAGENRPRRMPVKRRTHQDHIH
jgi:hypothetical protein